jgi:hypothetical protein
LKKYKGDCYPIFATLGISAHINFNNTSYLHHFTSSADTDFYYFIKLFSRIPYHEESILEKNIYFLSVHLYNYDDLGLRVDIIQSADFYDSFEDVVEAVYPIPNFFLPHHRFVLSFSGDDKYAFPKFEKILKSWHTEILNS